MITAVTSFNVNEVEQAKRFIETFSKYWPKEVALRCWYHGGPLTIQPVVAERITYHNLEEQPPWQQFCKMTEHFPKSEDYRYNLHHFTPKMYALFCTDFAQSEWGIWLDNDIETYAELPLDELHMWLKGDMVRLERDSVPYGETSFLAFNIKSSITQTFLQALASTYHTGEVTSYKEFHDGFVIERLISIFKNQGMDVVSLSKGVEGLDAFHQSCLGDYMVHYKGPAKEGNPTVHIKPEYSQLTDLVTFYEPSDFYFDVDDPNRIYQVLIEASKKKSTLRVFTKNTSRSIMSRLVVADKILNRKGCKVDLVPFDDLVEPFVYYDGRRAITEVKEPLVAVMSNYITPGQKALRGPSQKFDDLYKEVRLVGSIAYASKKAFNLSRPLRVQPKNAVDSSELIENVKTNTPKFSKWVTKCAIHDREAILISAGPTLKKEIDTIKELISSGKEKVIFCVKHALSTLYEAGIEPHGCIILDARPLEGNSTHMVKRKDLYANVPPEMTFYIATMCAPETVDYLISLGNPIVGWHAANQGMMEAGLKEFATGMLVAGGTCAAWRQFAIAHAFGFRTFHLFGYDFYYESKESKTSNEIMQVFVGPNKTPFFSTGELVAALQDFEHINKLVLEYNLNLYVYGDGMVAACWQPPPKLQSWEEYLDFTKP